MQNLSKIGQETKKLQKMGNDVIVTLFLKIAPQFLVCEYFLLILIDVPSFKLIEGQIKELQGVVPNTSPLAENDQKSPGRIGLIYDYFSCPAFSQFDWLIIGQDSAILPDHSAAKQN